MGHPSAQACDAEQAPAAAPQPRRRHAQGINPDGRPAAALVEWYWSRRRSMKAATRTSPVPA